MPGTTSSVIVLTAPHLGLELIAARKRCKLTQAQIAAQLGLSQNRVSYLERNAEHISFAQLLSYCSAVGLQLRLAERESADTSSEW